MKKLTICLTLVALSTTFLSGCVAQDEVDRREQVVRTLEDQVYRLQNELDQANAALNDRQQEISQESNVVQDLQRQNATLRRQLADSVQKLKDLAGRMSELGKGLTDPEMQAALSDLAASNPDLFTYDQSSGVIRLGSDVTFNSGSSEVKPQAAAALKKLAAILKSHLDRPFEVWVVGYTDSQPIGKSRNRYPTNMHLSAYRAISVRDVLVREGLPPDRVGIGGWGQYRPVAPASPKGEKANRRVEIYLRPLSSTAGTTAPQQASAPQKKQPSPAKPLEDIPMK
ncbi:MAG TPA: hypothetical protein ENJ06_00105 [Phycisphaeraceae bacterium]|nr:hypothetical protein [Phycisphaeraceae bacterium]